MAAGLAVSCVTGVPHVWVCAVVVVAAAHGSTVSTIATPSTRPVATAVMATVTVTGAVVVAVGVARCCVVSACGTVWTEKSMAKQLTPSPQSSQSWKRRWTSAAALRSKARVVGCRSHAARRCRTVHSGPRWMPLGRVALPTLPRRRHPRETAAEVSGRERCSGWQCTGKQPFSCSAATQPRQRS